LTRVDTLEQLEPESSTGQLEPASEPLEPEQLEQEQLEPVTPEPVTPEPDLEPEPASAPPEQSEPAQPEQEQLAQEQLAPEDEPSFGVNEAADASQVPLEPEPAAIAAESSSEYGAHDAGDEFQLALEASAQRLRSNRESLEVAASGRSIDSDDDDLRMLMYEATGAQDESLVDLGSRDSPDITSMHRGRRPMPTGGFTGQSRAADGSERHSMDDDGSGAFDMLSESRSRVSRNSWPSSGVAKREATHPNQSPEEGTYNAASPGSDYGFLKQVDSFLTEQGRTPRDPRDLATPTPRDPFSQTLQPAMAARITGDFMALNATAPALHGSGRHDAEGPEDDDRGGYYDEADFEAAVTGRRDSGPGNPAEQRRGRLRPGEPYGRAARAAKQKSFVVRIRDIKLTAEQARLYGVGVSANGDLDLAPKARLTQVASAMGLEAELRAGPRYNQAHLARLAEPIERDEDALPENVERECTFQPRKDQRAIRAMQNPRCGYDFMDRLKNRDELVVRLEGEARKRRQNEERREEAQAKAAKEAGRGKVYFNERRYWERQARLERKADERKKKILEEELAKNRGPSLNTAKRTERFRRAAKQERAAGTVATGSSSTAAKMRSLLF